CGLGAKGDGVIGLADLGADGGVENGSVRREAVHVDVLKVQHQPNHRVEVPVHADRPDLLIPAANGVGGGRSAGRAGVIVQVDVGVANGDFPGAPAAAVQLERMAHGRSVEGGRVGVVSPSLTGKDPTAF